MIDGAISALLRAGLIETRSPADMLAPASLLSERGAVLPLDHARLLSFSNGLTAYGGYFRLFGIGPGATRDMRRWNLPGTWRHAWAERADGWWCFGETAWGDQYAYATGDDPLTSDTTVYRLEACRLEPEPIADGFAEFLCCELAPNAAGPRDHMTIVARERFGDLDAGTQLTYLPSLLMGGEEDVGNLVTLPARAAMVAAGHAHRASLRTALSR